MKKHLATLAIIMIACTSIFAQPANNHTNVDYLAQVGPLVKDPCPPCPPVNQHFGGVTTNHRRLPRPLNGDVIINNFTNGNCGSCHACYSGPMCDQPIASQCGPDVIGQPQPSFPTQPVAMYSDNGGNHDLLWGMIVMLGLVLLAGILYQLWKLNAANNQKSQTPQQQRGNPGRNYEHCHVEEHHYHGDHVTHNNEVVAVMERVVTVEVEKKKEEEKKG